MRSKPPHSSPTEAGPSMAPSRIPALDRSLVELGEAPWVLVLAGLSASGERRGGRATADAAAAGHRVVVVTGAPGRLTGNNSWPSSAAVVDVGEVERERHQAAMWSRVERVPGLPRPARAVARRLNAAGRSRRLWKLLAPALTASHVMPPTHVVYGDDYALTAEWHLARRWPGTHVSASWEDSEAPT